MKKKIQIAEDEYYRLVQDLDDAKREIERLTGLEEKSVYPNLRISGHGKVLFANLSAGPVLDEWQSAVNHALPEKILEAYPMLKDTSGSSGFLKIPFRNFTISFMVVPTRSLNCVMLYGTSIEYTNSSGTNGTAALIKSTGAVILRKHSGKSPSIEYISGNVHLFGYESSDFGQGKFSFLDLVSPSDKAKMLKDMQTFIENGYDTFTQEYRLVCKNKEIRWVEDRSKLIDKEKGIIDSVLFDVTDRKTLEHKLKNEHEELIKVNHELDRFVYSASHDLKAPLRSIVGLINLARTETKDPAIEEYLEMILKSASKLDNFIGDLINFSRSTGMEVNITQIDFDRLIPETIENIKYMENASKIKIHSEVNDVPFYSDNNRLAILFSNMISNAIKYQKLDGSETPELKIKIGINKKQGIFSFSDNGIGIDQEHVNNIFKMFFRASTQSEGSGLGLFIVKEIIRKLNGSIRIESKIGKGTEFIVTLPNEFKG